MQGEDSSFDGVDGKDSEDLDDLGNRIPRTDVIPSSGGTASLPRHKVHTFDELAALHWREIEAMTRSEKYRRYLTVCEDRSGEILNCKHYKPCKQHVYDMHLLLWLGRDHSKVTYINQESEAMLELKLGKMSRNDDETRLTFRPDICVVLDTKRRKENIKPKDCIVAHADFLRSCWRHVDLPEGNLAETKILDTGDGRCVTWSTSIFTLPPSKFVIKREIVQLLLDWLYMEPCRDVGLLEELLQTRMDIGISGEDPEPLVNSDLANIKVKPDLSIIGQILKRDWGAGIYLETASKCLLKKELSVLDIVKGISAISHTRSHILYFGIYDRCLDGYLLAYESMFEAVFRAILKQSSTAPTQQPTAKGRYAGPPYWPFTPYRSGQVDWRQVQRRE